MSNKYNKEGLLTRLITNSSPSLLQTSISPCLKSQSSISKTLEVQLSKIGSNSSMLSKHLYNNSNSSQLSSNSLLRDRLGRLLDFLCQLLLRTLATESILVCLCLRQSSRIKVDQEHSRATNSLQSQFPLSNRLVLEGLLFQ